jgi:ABC-type branched-subunit amino acid transport system ATPase component
MSLLAFRDVTKRFRDGGEQIAVLDRVSFEVEVGETVGLLASRRGGKTTLLKVAAGLIPPDEGSVLWDDVELTQMSRDEGARARREGGIAYARGEWRTSRSMSVLECVTISLHNGSPTIEEAEERAAKTLELLGASHLARRNTTELGMSERVLVELARAVVRKPRLLLMDEPAVLRNPDHARAFYELLRSLPKKIGCALLIASEEVTPLAGCKPMMNLANGHLTSTASRRKVIDFPTGGSSSGKKAS